MRKVIILVSALFMMMSNAQETKQAPLISVIGEGKVKVVPDQARITATVETKGNNAIEVKKQNDDQMAAVLKVLIKMKLAPSDFRTQRVSLNPVYDYEKKKTSYTATQTIEILLRDLAQYDVLMEGIVNQGVNSIDNVIFQSSIVVDYQSEARKLAMKDAKSKAEDYVSVLGQKVGKAIYISDNSQNYQPQSVSKRIQTMSMDDSSAITETLAAGEITITANVNVSFVLE